MQSAADPFKKRVFAPVETMKLLGMMIEDQININISEDSSSCSSQLENILRRDKLKDFLRLLYSQDW